VGVPRRGSAVVYVVIALSGLTALACEVIWTRMLSLLLGATVYTFSLILAVFLIGLGIGSSVGSLLGRSLKQPKIALAWCQIGLCAAMAWTAWVLTQSLPYWPVNPPSRPMPGFSFSSTSCDVCMRCSRSASLGRLSVGARVVASKEGDPAKLVGAFTPRTLEPSSDR
jgi:spermidine synthase